MKKLFKYKRYSKIRFYKGSCPLTLLKFTKLKWREFCKSFYYLKKNFEIRKPKIKKFKKKKYYFFKKRRKKYFKRKFFVNLCTIRLIANNWYRLRYVLKNKLSSRVSWFLYFNNNKTMKMFYDKKNKLKLNLLLIRFYKAYFQLKVILWIIHFSRSIRHSSQLIIKGNIKINGKRVLNSYFLKKGDIISFNLLKNNYFFLNKNYHKLIKFFSYLETDYYSFNLIVIKDYDEINVNDLMLVVRQYYNIKDLV